MIEAIVTAAAALGGAHAGPALAVFGPLRRCVLPKRLSGIGRPGHVALTFDGGPDPQVTPELLRVLGRHHVRATFFLLGENVERHPAQARDIVGEGHEVGVLGHQHRLLLRRLPHAVAHDLSRATAAITAVTGRQPSWWRPPYGLASSTALFQARCLGLTPVLWTCSAREWTRAAAPPAVSRPGLRGGGTIVVRDRDRGTLPEILRDCHARGHVVGRLRDHGVPGVGAMP